MPQSLPRHGLSPRRRPGVRRAAVLACALALAGSLATALGTPAAAEPVGRAAGTPPPRLDADRPLLARAAHGEDAVRRLGDRLADVAALNGRRPAALARLLREDPSLWVDPSGRLLYRDGAPGPRRQARLAERSAAERAGARAAGPTALTYPVEQTFSLHSKPGSTHVIFLDFDGATVSGTQWNSYGVSTSPQPVFSTDGSTAFSTVEHAAMQSIWQRVAEDYAPFDVDVTTQDPGQAAIDRSTSADTSFGTRVLITPSSQAANAICGGGCGGVAFVDVFDLYPATDHAYYQPAWVFPQALSNDTKAIAEAATHEAGHNLGLDHDGGPASPDYDTGHGIWAPIMGAAYDRPVSQWSKGDYTGATNHQDDLAIIGAVLGLRTDEAGGTTGTAAAAPPSGTAYITTRGDQDVYALGTCSGTVGLAADPATVSPNLDLQVALLDAGGAVVASADPAGSASSYDVATGLDATLSTSVPSGTYFARVDGVGLGTPVSNYDDYASLGAYTLAVTGCGGETTPATTVPGAPPGVVASAVGQTGVLVQWDPPADDGGSAVTSYAVSLDGGPAQGAAASSRSFTFTGLAPGSTHTVTVAAVNAVGTGPTSGAQATTDHADPVVSTPGAVQSLTAAWSQVDQAVAVDWSPPADDGGAAVTGYAVYADGELLDSVADPGVLISGLEPGEHTVGVAAVNSEGAGPLRTATATVPAPPVTQTEPGAPTGLKARSGAAGRPITVRLTWNAPTDDGGAVVDGYRLKFFKYDSEGRLLATATSQVLGTSTTTVEFAVPKGRYRMAVQARNAVGWSAWSSRSGTVSAR